MTVIEFLQGKLREINNQDYVSVSNHYIKSKLEEWIHDEQEAGTNVSPAVVNSDGWSLLGFAILIGSRDAHDWWMWRLSI